MSGKRKDDQWGTERRKELSVLQTGVHISIAMTSAVTLGMIC